MPHTARLSAVPQYQVSTAVKGSRPLSSAAAELEKQLGVAITYEDPPWVFAGDLQGVTESVRKDGDLSTRVLIPRVAELTFVHSLPAVVDMEARAAAIEALVEAYHTSDSIARFRVVRSGSVFHIVPAMSRNEAGVLQPRGSLLDVPVSFAAQDRSLMSVVREITRQVSEASGVPVEGGAVAMNILMNTRTSAGAMNEDARIVLLRTLASASQPLSWHIHCGFDSPRACSLTIYVVRPSR